MATNDGVSIGASGFCPKRLENVDAYLQRLVDTGKVAGVSAMLTRHGDTAYRKSFGLADIAAKVPMTNESIYRIYSMSKTFTIVAAMTLYEKGLFKLRDPICEFLPEFSEPKVARHDERGVVQIIPAKNPIVFEHLFTMTSGIPYPGDTSFSARAMAEINAESVQAAKNGKPWNTAQMVAAAAKAPLCFHPGEYWMYGFSHDVLGRLIEVISGKSYGEYLKETILDPLGLKDTAFYVPAEKQSRLVKAYNVEAGAEGKSTLTEIPASTLPGTPTPPAFESGGGGLCSTLDDVGRYAQALLGGGKLGDVRILSRKTIELIKMNHVVPEQLKNFGFDHMAGYGYGLGVRTLLDRAKAGSAGSVGEWAWDGMMGTWYCVDPAEDLTAVFLVQRIPGAGGDLPLRFAQTFYSAIDD
ncbi:serine hydrolase [Spirochaetia bacterium]|nr:serine hydrolase [Spirochaetia bacterium]